MQHDMAATASAPAVPNKPRIWRAITAPLRALRRRPVPPAVTAPAAGTPRVGDWLIRAVAVIVLLGVAGAAGYVSYHHFFALSIALGEHQDMAVLYPAMSDGVIVMASLVMVYCSRRGIPVPLLAKVALGGGGVVTLIANVANGWDGGTGSRLLSALAPVAFVGAYELLMWIVRTSRKDVEAVAETIGDEHVCQPVEKLVEVVQVERIAPVDRFEAARLTFEQSLEPGNKRVGRRTLMNRWGLEQREADEIIAEVERELAQAAKPAVSRSVNLVPAVPSLNGSSPAGTAGARP